jgi:hypothetical protein
MHKSIRMFPSQRNGQQMMAKQSLPSHPTTNLLEVVVEIDPSEWACILRRPVLQTSAGQNRARRSKRLEQHMDGSPLKELTFITAEPRSNKRKSKTDYASSTHLQNSPVRSPIPSPIPRLAHSPSSQTSSCDRHSSPALDHCHHEQSPATTASRSPSPSSVCSRSSPTRSPSNSSNDNFSPHSPETTTEEDTIEPISSPLIEADAQDGYDIEMRPVSPLFVDIRPISPISVGSSPSESVVITTIPSSQYNTTTTAMAMTMTMTTAAESTQEFTRASRPIRSRIVPKRFVPKQQTEGEREIEHSNEQDNDRAKEREPVAVTVSPSEEPKNTSRSVQREEAKMKKLEGGFATLPALKSVPVRERVMEAEEIRLSGTKFRVPPIPQLVFVLVPVMSVEGLRHLPIAVTVNPTGQSEL